MYTKEEKQAMKKAGINPDLVHDKKLDKKKKLSDFDFLYNPESRTEKAEDIADITGILERNNVPLDHFHDRNVAHLINFMLHTAINWDNQIKEDLLHRDEQDGVD